MQPYHNGQSGMTVHQQKKFDLDATATTSLLHFLSLPVFIRQLFRVNIQEQTIFTAFVRIQQHVLMWTRITFTDRIPYTFPRLLFQSRPKSWIIQILVFNDNIPSVVDKWTFTFERPLVLHHIECLWNCNRILVFLIWTIEFGPEVRHWVWSEWLVPLAERLKC